MRIATIDVGTNTALLLIAEVADDAVRPVYEQERFVRLGAGVDATGQVSEAAMRRLRNVLLEYKATARAYEVDQIVVAGTSASRDARNRLELIDFVRHETGLSYEILSGEDEASLTFAGAVSAFDDLAGPCAVIDIGGGSTEIVVGEPRGGVRERHSLNVGSVRLTERYFASNPPEPPPIEEAKLAVQDALAASCVELPPGMPLVGAAGTLVALALVQGGVSSWDALGGRSVYFDADAIHTWCRRLLALSTEEVLALNPAVMQGRADVFPAGVLILSTVVRQFQMPGCRVSPRGVRHGLALRTGEQRAA